MTLKRFRPGWTPTLAMLVAMVLFGSLGAWQVRRAREKDQLLAEWAVRIERPPLRLAEVLASPGRHQFRRVRVRGRYDHAQSVLLLHVASGLRSGARVLTPLRTRDPEGEPVAVLVDRGWIPSERIDSFLEADASAGPAQVTGVVRLMEFGSMPEALVPRRVRWNRFQPSALQAQIPYPLAPILLQREAGEADELPAGDFEPPRSRVDHRSYAITWFSMAGLALATWVAMGLRQGGEAVDA